MNQPLWYSAPTAPEWGSARVPRRLRMPPAAIGAHHLAFLRGAWGIGTEDPGHDGGEGGQRNRLAESGHAAKNRGSQGPFFYMGDYPRVPNGQDIVEPVNEFREHRRAIVLTHGFEDPYNMDHPPANHGTLEARLCAEESGCPAEGKGSRDEPRRSSSSSRTIRCNAISGRRSGLKSRRSGSASAMAIESMAARQRLVKYSSVAGGRRAVERASDSGKRHIQYAEVFQRIDPRLKDRLS